MIYLSKYPKLILLFVALVFAAAMTQVNQFKIDASADALLLESDPDLAFFREINKRYSNDDFLLLTFTPSEGVFSEAGINTLKNIKADLQQLDRVKNIQSILDVPLLFSPPIAISDLAKGMHTIALGNVDISMAEQELLNSPLYKNLLLSSDSKTTAFQVVFERDTEYFKRLEARNDWLSKDKNTLSNAQKLEKENALKSFDEYKGQLSKKEQKTVQQMRDIVKRYENHGSFSLGGASMITSDIVNFIKSDLQLFGSAIFIFIILILFAFFKQARWVILPLVCCFVNLAMVTAALAILDWRVSIISSNYISLLLIMTLSICIHLIVKHRELVIEFPDLSQQALVEKTLSSMFKPCLFTSLTTIVAFASLIVSGIRPVINFGWIMSLGVSLAFLLSFILFPAMLLLFNKLKTSQHHSNNLTQKVTGGIARMCQHYPKAIMSSFVVLSLISIYGLSLLTVENRFIDYFKKDTEIYQGMLEIDTKLGGTTSLDIIINAPVIEETIDDMGEDDEDFDDAFEDEESANPLEDSYWYTPAGLLELEKIHQFIDELPQTGKVLSLGTVSKMARDINNGQEFTQLQLLLLHSLLPNEIKQSLLTPYLSEDGNQVRISARIIDSNKDINRNQFLKDLNTSLSDQFNLEGQVKFSGLLVLYNNLLQSLFSSQIKSLGFVFVAIFIMFIFIFRSIKVASIAILPNLFCALSILGFIGLIGLPLDLMTITVAAIAIGIAVDDTIHYVHRYGIELKESGDIKIALLKTHLSTGQAMYYTSVTVIVGFTILMLSNFNPSMYFGLLTGLAMLIALIANLILLPVLLSRFDLKFK